jgi:hypothetical protein
MTLSAALWEQVRARAEGKCEYCGVGEIDTGGKLTVDHFHPRSLGGSDDVENLLYTCFRCNTYKGDYWPTSPATPSLWNPRTEPAERHLLLLADGRLNPFTPTGSLTVALLHLNRTQLVQYRLLQVERTDYSRRLARMEERLTILESLQRQHSTLVTELLDANRELVVLLRKAID